VIGFLIKGLWRDRARSSFPAATVIAGVMLTVFFQTYIGGINSNLSESSAAFSTGHLKVMSRAYAKEGEQAPNELAYTGVRKLLDQLRQQSPDLIWTPRIRFAGLIDIPDEKGQTRAQAPMFGMGINLLSGGDRERRIMNLERSIVLGHLPSRHGEILLSDQLARELGVGPGATATLISSTMFGSMATSNFTVAGTVNFGIRAMDRGAMIADVEDIQMALDMEDTAGEVLGFFRDSLYHRRTADAIAKRLNAGWASIADEFAPTVMTMHDQPGAGEFMDYISAVSAAVVAIFTVVMSIVLWNAGLIGGLRRYGEIGLRLAFGEDNGRLYRAMLVESLVIGIVGTLVGTALALVPSYWLQVKGLDLGFIFANSSLMLNSVLRTEITPATFFVGFIPGLLANVIGTAFSGIGIYKRQTATLMKELEA
jgi:putative ABC transport system permease protein